MGARCAAVIAGFGAARVFLVARNIDKSRAAVQVAAKSIRSNAIIDSLVPKTYEDLQQCVEASDWVLEAVAEDYAIKDEVNATINEYRFPGTIVSTVSSGLSISRLAQAFNEDGRRHYFGTHFFNPPYMLPLCELVSHDEADEAVEHELIDYLESILLREVVRTADTPGFAANRIGFELLNEIARCAEEHADSGGIAFMDAVMGRFTGRAMPPLETIDFVGLDIHQAIVENIRQNTEACCAQSLALPAYLQHLINLGRLGRKVGEGLYKRERDQTGNLVKLVYDIEKQDYLPVPRAMPLFRKNVCEAISVGDYRSAMAMILESEGDEVAICRKLMLKYIAHAFSLIGTVVDNRDDIDRVMGYGFNWIPPSALVDLFGGWSRTKDAMLSAGVRPPDSVMGLETAAPVYRLQNVLDARRFLQAN